MAVATSRMARAPEKEAPELPASSWRLVRQLLSRPYKLMPSMIGVMLLVPCYLFIAQETAGRAVHWPETAIDVAIPVMPVWSVVYTSLYVFIFLPILLLTQEQHIRGTFRAYLMTWTVAYVVFLAYPTEAPRPAKVIEDGFFPWVLAQVIYGTDPPYNCFPSLHVAHSFVSALSCYRVNRGVGLAAGAWVALIGVSTVFTKQHYAIDVPAGMGLAYVAYFVFIRRFPREAIPELDRRVAPIVLLGFVALHVVVLTCVWVVYETSIAP